MSINLTGSKKKRAFFEYLEAARLEKGLKTLKQLETLASDQKVNVPFENLKRRYFRSKGSALPDTIRDETWSDLVELLGISENGWNEFWEKYQQSSMHESEYDAPLFFNIPIHRNRYFTGRDDILNRLLKSFSTSKTIALSGLAGTGKTQISVEYAYRFQSQYSAVLWVSADGQELATQNFANLSDLLGFKAEKLEDRILAVQSWLHSHQRWLLVFDNAETLDVLTFAKNLVPGNAVGHILFTTRAQALGDILGVSIECFDEVTGAILLLRRTKSVPIDLPEKETSKYVTSEQWDRAIELVKELGGLALAIDQAGAYIEQTDCGLDGYLKRYRNDASTMLKERGFVPSVDHPEPVYKTLLLCLENAERRHPYAKEILLDSALLHPDGIPERLYDDQDPLELDKALAALKDYSLIQRVTEKKLFIVHRLVQIVVRDVCE